MKITGIPKRWSNWRARVHYENVVEPRLAKKLHALPGDENWDARFEVNVKRSRLAARHYGHSAELIHRFDYHGQNVLVSAVCYGNLPALVRFVENGANMSLRYNTIRHKPLPDITLLHWAATQSNVDVYRFVALASTNCSACVRDGWRRAPIHLAYNHVGILKTLIYEFNASVTVFDRNGSSPLTYLAAVKGRFRLGPTSPAEDCARLLLECDYERAMQGCARFDATSTMKLLTTRNCHGRTPLDCARLANVEKNRKLIRLLEGWEISSLTVPPPGYHSSTASLLLNPELTPFQGFLAHHVLGVLDASPIHEVSSQVLGFLTPMDVLANWNEWLGVGGSDGTPCRCCCSCGEKISDDDIPRGNK